MDTFNQAIRGEGSLPFGGHGIRLCPLSEDLHLQVYRPQGDRDLGRFPRHGPDCLEIEFFKEVQGKGAIESENIYFTQDLGKDPKVSPWINGDKQAVLGEHSLK